MQQTRVAPEAEYRFKHVLTQEVAYSSLLEHQRRELHGRVGAQIEQLYAGRLDEHADRLAHHFSRAEEWEKAVGYGLRSAERAVALAQFSEALQILERTQRWLAKLPAGPGAPQRADGSAAAPGAPLRDAGPARAAAADHRRADLPPRRRPRPASGWRRSYLRQGDLFTLMRQLRRGGAALEQSLALRREPGRPASASGTPSAAWGCCAGTRAATARRSSSWSRRSGSRAAAATRPPSSGDLINLGAILRALGELDPARAVAAGGARPGGAPERRARQSDARTS